MKSGEQNIEFGFGTSLLDGTLTMNGESIDPNSNMFFLMEAFRVFMKNLDFY